MDPIPYIRTAFRVLVALALVAAGYWIAHTRGDADIAELKAQHAAALQTAAERAQRAEADARTEERRRTLAVQEAADADRLQAARRLAAADAARATAERVRNAAIARARALAAAAASRAAAPDGGPPAADPDLLPAELLGRCAQRVAELARFADAAHAAGSVCQRAYTALTGPE